ncbi:male sterility protein-domain-containing protein [Cerioporus squamosus]|nr:male sterility protein-domain-containing protein [Cerioporus squamosus]
MTWTMFKPSWPAVLPTPETFLDSLIATRSEIVYCVPAFIEAWAQNPDNMAKIRTLRAMIYAGAPMNKQIGDAIAAENIALIPFYGLTEIGAVVRLIPDPDTMDKPEWDYFQISPHINLRLIPQEGQPGLFEPVAFESATNTPNVFNAVIDGLPAYATSDLLEQHPTKPHLFRVFGRVDDQLMLSTGEKTNPAPLEAILLEDPNVYACLMFGRGRFQNGVLIQPEEGFDPSDEAALEAYRNKIWPSIEKMNAYAPSHSRIFKEMIMVTKPEKPLEYTAKGTPRRQVCIASYSEEIDALYKKVEESSQLDIAPPRDWSPESVHQYVREIVRNVMKNPDIKDTDDLFQQGCDSLQATWIRNTTIHALRSSSSVNVHAIPSTFVYSNPTIIALAAYISGMISGKALDKDAERAAAIDRMRTLLDKYSAGLEARFPEKHANGYANGHVNGNGHINGNGHVNGNGHDNGHANGKGHTNGNGHANGHGLETVLVTGTTGRLGSHLLAQLLERMDVARVYALNRGAPGSEESLEKRNRAAFRQWGLDESLLDSGRVSFHPADLSKPNFDLGEPLYEEMRNSVTQIIHNAWRVDFNVALPSFEPLIAGARNLLDFALSSSIPGGPRTLFVSSISSMRHHAYSTPAAETLDVEPSIAYGMGYSESKWVTEQLFGRAAKQTGLKTTSVRVGQVSGDQTTGGWNTTEWVAALVRVSQRLGCIPVKDEDLTWVAVDVVASALQDFVESDERVLHLVSPYPVPWNSVFIPIAERLGVPAVPYTEWLARLEQSAAAASARPSAEQHDAAHNLIDFFKTSGMGGSKGPLSTEKAVRCSKALAELRPIGREDALNYVEFWGKVGHLKL